MRNYSILTTIGSFCNLIKIVDQTNFSFEDNLYKLNIRPDFEVNFMSKEPYVDPDLCTGCELCVDTCSNVFKMTDDGVAEVYDSSGDSEENIQDAIDNCPSEAISWKE